MFNHTIFISYLAIFLISTIGYGYLFSFFFYKDFKKLNFGYLGILGFFSIILISTTTIFFTSHNYIHNIILHFIGFLAFSINFFNNKKRNYDELKKLLLVFIIMGTGIYIFKNHDDFPYYHLTYTLNLSQNSLLIGTGAFSHGFRTMSSLFYYHSTLYLPMIKFYLFHSGPFFILIFFNYIILSKLFAKFKKKELDIVYFFSLLNFIFVNIVFYRLAEHGTDRSGQVLLFLIFVIFFEILFLKKTNQDKKILFNFLLVATFLATSMKVLFIIYLILVPIVLYRDKFYKDYFVKANLKICIVLIFSFALNTSNNFFSTGCLIYPEEKTCFFEKFEWSIPEKEVKTMKLHYEWWAKAGGGPGYKSKIKPEIYVKEFNWFKDWVERHFFNKVSDTLLGIIFIALINLILFKNTKKKKIPKRNILMTNLILFIFFIEWFLKHPSMRYGGYVLFALPIFIFASKKIETYKVNNKKIFNSTVFLVLLTLVIYNGRNIIRLNEEINNYSPGYNIIKSPFFNIVDTQVKVIYEKDNFKIYKPKKGMCWAAQTPCSYYPTLKVSNWYGYNVITRYDPTAESSDDDQN